MVSTEGKGLVKPSDNFIVYAQTTSSSPAKKRKIQAITALPDQSRVVPECLPLLGEVVLTPKLYKRECRAVQWRMARGGKNKKWPFDAASWTKELFRAALCKEPWKRAVISFGKARSFFEAGVDSSVLDCFKKSEATQPNGINQRFPSQECSAWGSPAHRSGALHSADAGRWFFRSCPHCR